MTRRTCIAQQACAEKNHVCRLRDPPLTLALLHSQVSVNLTTGQARVETVAHGHSTRTFTELITAAEAAGFPARGGSDTISEGTSVVLDVQGLKVCCGLPSITERRHAYQFRNWGDFLRSQCIVVDDVGPTYRALRLF